MGSTYYSLHYHFVCSTKGRRPFIRADWRNRFFEYLGGTVRGLDGIALQIGGVEDHIHMLVGLKPTHCLSDFTREWKKSSSVWISEKAEKDFEWQEGYSVFSVSTSMLKAVARYIERQDEHHRKLSFKEELKLLLEKHEIRYEARYLL